MALKSMRLNAMSPIPHPTSFCLSSSRPSSSHLSSKADKPEERLRKQNQKYRKSQNGRDANARYYYSEKGQDAQIRHRQKPETKRKQLDYQHSQRGQNVIVRNNLITSIAVKEVGSTKAFNALPKNERIAMRARIRAELDAKDAQAETSLESNCTTTARDSSSDIANNIPTAMTQEHAVGESSPMQNAHSPSPETSQASAPMAYSVCLLDKYVAQLEDHKRADFIATLPESMQQALFHYTKQNVSQAIVAHFHGDNMLPEAQLTQWIQHADNDLLVHMFSAVAPHSQEAFLRHVSLPQIQHLMQLLDDMMI